MPQGKTRLVPRKLVVKSNRVAEVQARAEMPQGKKVQARAQMPQGKTRLVPCKVVINGVAKVQARTLNARGKNKASAS
eukprot:s1763_g7.t1